MLVDVPAFASDVRNQPRAGEQAHQVNRWRVQLHASRSWGHYGRSWLNQVERWFALLTEQALRRGVHRSTQALEQAIRDYIDSNNENPKPFIWTKTADQIIAAVARHCQRQLDLYVDDADTIDVADSGH